MLDRLQARETVELINALSYATGHMDPKQSGRYVEHLHERAYPGTTEEAKPRRAQSVEEMQRLMMGDGLSGMRMVLETGPQEAARTAEQAQEVRDAVQPEEVPA